MCSKAWRGRVRHGTAGTRDSSRWGQRPMPLMPPRPSVSQKHQRAGVRAPILNRFVFRILALMVRPLINTSFPCLNPPISRIFFCGCGRMKQGRFFAVPALFVFFSGNRLEMVIFGEEDTMVERSVEIDARVFLKAQHGNRARRVTTGSSTRGKKSGNLRFLDAKRSVYEGS